MIPEDLIVDKIINDITRGTYNEDEKLPSENTLAEVMQVPRIIARKAYEKLDAMGYTYSVQGKGRYVKTRRQKIELVISGNESFTSKMLENGYALMTQQIMLKKISYNEYVYRELRVDVDTDVYKIGRLRIIDGKPVALHISYVSQCLFKNIATDGKEILSMFAYYRKVGYTSFATGKSILSITYPNHKERKLLQCESLVPLLTIETNCMDDNTGQILEYTRIKYRGDYFKYVIS
ncbi:GntR family transcriptional regulator [Dendrosporobacter sp. 1207_IL3150]|uniref:GntR family transcriptional regulator n=1 Tax=Dendrosporobacter sp. 1207_IL3150 TaxID=3084054 RepID=UPI002FD8BC94